MPYRAISYYYYYYYYFESREKFHLFEISYEDKKS